MKLWSQIPLVLLLRIPIDSNTCHSDLGLSFGNRVRESKFVVQQDYRSQDSESSELFAGLTVVMFWGDFYQFPPAKSVPLRGQAGDNNVDEQTRHDILASVYRRSRDNGRTNATSRRQPIPAQLDLTLLNSKVILNSLL
jgi:hypothetical protein